MGSLMQKQCRPLPPAGSCSLCRQDAINESIIGVVCHNRPQLRHTAAQEQNATITYLILRGAGRRSNFVYFRDQQQQGVR